MTKRSSIKSMYYTNMNNCTELLLTIDNESDLDSLIFETALSICSLRNVPDEEIINSWWYKAYMDGVGFSSIEEAEIVEDEEWT